MDQTEMDEVTWGINQWIKPSTYTIKEADYINSVIRLVGREIKRKYTTLLDVPCGEGRLHSRLRSLGYEVYGVDINPKFIKRAKERYKRYSTDYLTANMKSFRLNRKFDVVLCWFGSFGYLSESDNMAALKAFSKHLNKDGILIVDVLNKDWFAANTRVHEKHLTISEHPRFLRLVTGFLVNKRGHRYFMHTSKIYGKTGDNLKLVKRFRLPMRLYEPSEMNMLLQRVGIRTIHKFELMSLKQGAKAQHIVFVGVRT